MSFMYKAVLALLLLVAAFLLMGCGDNTYIYYLSLDAAPDASDAGSPLDMYVDAGSAQDAGSTPDSGVPNMCPGLAEPGGYRIFNVDPAHNTCPEPLTITTMYFQINPVDAGPECNATIMLFLPGMHACDPTPFPLRAVWNAANTPLPDMTCTGWVYTDATISAEVAIRYTCDLSLHLNTLVMHCNLDIPFYTMEPRWTPNYECSINFTEV